MKIARAAGVLAFLAIGVPVWAHTHLVKAAPANGSTVQAPTAFVLTFTEPAKLTTASLQKAGEPAKKIESLPTAAAAQISIPAPTLAAGKYTLTWRVLSNDGHVMPGKLTFTVQ